MPRAVGYLFSDELRVADHSVHVLLQPDPESPWHPFAVGRLELSVSSLD